MSDEKKKKTLTDDQIVSNSKMKQRGAGGGAGTDADAAHPATDQDAPAATDHDAGH